MDVTEKTFHRMDPAAQNWVLFDSIKKLDQKISNFNVSCAEQHKEVDEKIKRSGKINRRISAGGGFIGGFIAMLMSKFFTGG